MVNLDIYVKHPIDGKWYILDMFKDETINLNFKIKDLNDISKVFSTYSQDFTIPASGNNNKALNYFFDTKLFRVRERSVEAKIYVNGRLFRVGQLVVKEGKVENFTLLNYKVEFRTVIAQLKEKVGDDIIGNVIGDLLNEQHSIPWDSQSVYDRIVNSLGNEDILVPLVSNRRVWTYKDAGPNDIHNPALGIDKYELRPAIKLSILLDHLIQHYDLNIDFPLKTTDTFQKLYIWLNGKSDDDDEQPPVTYNYSFPSTWNLAPDGIIPNSKMFFDVTTDNGGMKIVDTGADFSLTRNYAVTHFLGDLKSSEDGSNYTGKVVATITNRLTGESFTSVFNDSNGGAIINYNLKQAKAGTNRIFDVKFTFDKPVESNNITTLIRVEFSIGTPYPDNAIWSIESALPLTNPNFNIKYALGEWKVIDLFSSIFKTFNLRVIEDFNNNSMLWLTPYEYYAHNRTKDINKSTDIINYTIQPSTNYKQIEFKHKEEGYFRNVEYQKLVNKGYGSEVYKSEDKALTESYQVETGFSLMNWFILSSGEHLTSLKTSYGFSKPGSTHNPSAPTIMYNEGFEIIREGDDAQNVNFRFKIPNQTTPNNTNQLARYIKFGNQTTDLENSITFDIDINPEGNEPMINSLYSKYYRTDIERLYQPNSNYFNFEGYLSLEGIMSFDMRDRLIIEDNKYTIEEASIDITTGKFKYKLLNIVQEFVEVVPPPPTPATFLANGGYQKIDGAVNVGSTDPEALDHYEIQYRKQGNSNWIPGLNLPYVPFVSQTWTIHPVTPAGMYDVRIRSIKGFTYSDWTYANNLLVTGVTPALPISGIGDLTLREFPCSNFVPYLSPSLPNNVRVFISENKAYFDEELRTPLDRSIMFSDLDMENVSIIDVDNFGKIIAENPCVGPYPILMANKAYKAIDGLNTEEWNITDKKELYVDKPFSIGTKFYLDSELSTPFEETSLFEQSYMMVKFLDNDEVRYVKINDNSVGELPLPINK